ncbi:MAG: hypothetical protein R6V13_08635 [Anaerolineae bacterium]
MPRKYASVRNAFERCIEDGSWREAEGVVAEVRGEQYTMAQLAKAMKEVNATMASVLCTALSMPQGSTYAEAARMLLEDYDVGDT